MAVSDSFIKNVADSRHDLHSGHSSSRPLSEDYELVGLSGEFAFAEVCGLLPDLTVRPGGDKGVDFTVPLRFTVDVKTARKAGNLIHEQGKPMVDIYVLAEFDDEKKKATLVGWEYGRNLAKAPAKDFGYGVSITTFIVQNSGQ